MKIPLSVVLVVSILTAAFFSSCQSLQKRPEADLNDIYGGAAKRNTLNRNAVIVIPGILGSRLVEQPSGQMVWGAFSRDAANPKAPESARLISLPMQEGQALSQLTDSVQAHGALETFRVSLFSTLSVQPKAYLQILSVLGAGGFRDETMGRANQGIDYGNDHYNCFQFAYDWRRSSAENAALLGQFIKRKKAYIESENLKRYGERGQVKFNLVAHSMGSLIARYYLRYGEQGMPSSGKPTLNWSGANHIEKVIMIAPPNAGSIISLEQLIAGLNLGPFTFKYPPAILGTMPSLYELLPRARHRVLKDTLQDTDLDPLEIENWQQREWGLLSPDQEENLAILLPSITSKTERRQVAYEHLSKCLLNARRFQEALDRPATHPEHVKLILFAGDATQTAVQAEAWPGEIKLVDYTPGDSIVARYSALMDERFSSRDSEATFQSPIAWDRVTFLFESHLELTQSRTFADNVLFELLEMN